MKVLLAQIGRRRNYIVPRAFQQLGSLELFYTDIWVRENARSIVDRLGKSGYFRKISSLRDRYDPLIPCEKVRSFGRLGFQYAYRFRKAKTESERAAVYLWMGEAFCNFVVRNGLSDANIVYGFNSASLELFRFAKQKGLMTILDQTVLPEKMKYMLRIEERERYPNWAEPISFSDSIKRLIDREEQEWRYSDAVICGSRYLLQEITPTLPQTVHPYILEGVGGQTVNEIETLDHDWSGKKKLRVLFVGNLRLRKGIGDFAQAAAQLEGVANFYAAGASRLTPYGEMMLKKSVSLLGRLTRTELEKEYRKADVVVLPSIFEGSAKAVYEALSFGLPVITTPNTGSVVEDGKHGFIVPIRKPTAIAEKIELLSGDRTRLMEMSQSARKISREYGEDRYFRNLHRIVQETLKSKSM